MILTLCGSARFEPLFHAMNEALTLCGHTVFSLVVFPSVKGVGKNWYTEEQKRLLDEAHFRKIDASDGIVVLNRFAYLGESTLREIAYAKERKSVYFLESWGAGCGVGRSHTQAAQDEKAAAGIPADYVSPIDTFCPFPYPPGAPYGLDAGFNLFGPAGETRMYCNRLIDEAKGKFLGAT